VQSPQPPATCTKRDEPGDMSRGLHETDDDDEDDDDDDGLLPQTYS